MNAIATNLVHHPFVPPAGFEAPQPGVFKASTVFFDSVAAMRATNRLENDGYYYGLIGTPTTYLLEERVASLDGGTHCVLVSSGLASIAVTNLALLKAGDEVLVPENAYGLSKAMAQHALLNWGITHLIYDPMRPSDLAAKVSAKTKLIWLEAPGSASMEFPDLRELISIGRRAGAVLALDNAWGAGVAFNPFDLGVDVSAHPLTKYVSGGGDVVMGAITTRCVELHQKIKFMRVALGWGVGANDAETILRALPTLHLRYAAHDTRARALAAWLAERSEVSEVRHPAIASSPGHAHWKSVCGDRDSAGGLFSIVMDPKYTSEEVDAFCDALKLFRVGHSWGAAQSLVMPYDLRAMRSNWLGGILIRLAIGLEDLEDLKADLARALAMLPNLSART